MSALPVLTLLCLLAEGKITVLHVWNPASLVLGSHCARAVWMAIICMPANTSVWSNALRGLTRHQITHVLSVGLSALCVLTTLRNVWNVPQATTTTAYHLTYLSAYCSALMVTINSNNIA